jgi:hypothetical protein
MQRAVIRDLELYNETVLADAIILCFKGEEIVIWQRPEAEVSRRREQNGGEFRSVSIEVKSQGEVDYWRSLINQQKDGDEHVGGPRESPST